jgi:hypothetical protein
LLETPEGLPYPPLRKRLDMKIVAIILAAAIPPADLPDPRSGFCCRLPDFGGVCTTDVGKDGKRSVTIKRTTKGKISVTVKNHPGGVFEIPDGVYPCLEMYPTGTPVF